MNSRYDLLKQTYLFSLLIISGLMISIGYWSWSGIKEDRFNDLTSTASFLNSFYEHSFNQRELGLTSVGERLLAVKGPSQKQERLDIAINSIRLHNDFLALGLVDTTGQLITFTGSLNQTNLPNLAASSKTKRTFEQAKRAHQIVIGEAYYFDEISDWIVPIRVPLRDKAGILRAVNTSAISLAKLLEELQDFKINSQYSVQLVNAAFNTTQLYYPLERSRYDSVLRQPAKIYQNIVVEKEDNGSQQFFAFNSISNQKIIGVKSATNKLDHYVVITASRSILANEFIEVFFLLFVIYLSLGLTLSAVYWYLRRKEKNYQHELAAERGYSTTIIDSTSALIVGIDKDGTCVFVNPAAENTIGYTKQEVIGKNWWQILYPGNLYSQVVKLHERGNNTAVKNHEMTLLTKQGSSKIISWSSFRIFDQKKNLKQIIGIGIDVSEQRMIEQAIAEREANLQSIFESTNNIIGLFNKKYELIEFNDAFKVYAKQADNLELYKGMPVLDLMNRPQAEMFRSFLSRALQGEKLSKVIDYPGQLGTLHFLMTYNPIFQGEQITGASMFVQDITELRNTQNELKKYTENLELIVKQRSEQIVIANVELQSSNEQLTNTIARLQHTQAQLVQSEKMASLGILSAGVGHEINNPLNFIKGGLTALTAHLHSQNKEIEAEVKPFIDIIHEGVSRASAIVKGLSQFSRQSSQLDEECDVHKILDNCIIILAGKLKHKVVLEKNYMESLPTVRGNEGQLHQVFLNILANAEQAIGQKGTICITTSVDQNSIKISISDTGMGISPENLSKISDPFFTTKAPGEGTGLGLSIAYKIIDEHKGKINVYSTVAKGTEFVLLLPI